VTGRFTPQINNPMNSKLFATIMEAQRKTPIEDGGGDDDEHLEHGRIGWSGTDVLGGVPASFSRQ
jgi:hypothetical protein